MGLSSHSGWEYVSESQEHQMEHPVDMTTIGQDIRVPAWHTEALMDHHELSLHDVARHVYSDGELFGPGLQQEWQRLAGPWSAPELFQSAYERYVSHPAGLLYEAPQIYQFLKDHVFYGLEYRATTFTEQVHQGIESLRPIEALRPEVWERLTVQERTAALQFVEYQLADREGRPAAQVMVDITAPPNLNGQYDSRTNIIHLNQDRVTDSHGVIKSVDTIAHEGRHAYQHFCVAHPGFHPDAVQVQNWAYNFSPGQYRTCQDYGPFLYLHQPVEADAFAFGDAIRNGLYGGQHE